MAGAAAIAVAAQVPPLRNFLLGKVKQGDGPDESRRAKSWFTVDFVAEGDGRTDPHPGLGRRPGLHRDRQDARRVRAVPGSSTTTRTSPAQVTTAEAMGDNLMARLVAAGITFEVVD